MDHVCVPCDYARAHGYWGDTIPASKTHHPCCHLTISSKVWHCVACCRSFSRDSHADKHRVNGQCVDPTVLRTKPRDGSPSRPVLVQRDDGVWSAPPPESPLPFWKAP